MADDVFSRCTILGLSLALAACSPSSTDEGSGGGSLSATVGSGGDGGSAEPPSEPAAPLALVELFTSEGCNSCPPVEDRFATVKANYIGQRAFFLAWHVDYWDYLGWPDPYGSEDHSNRQRSYASAFEANTIFTPDVRVNTLNQQPPSVEQVSFAIDAALAQEVTAAITLWHDPSLPDPVPVAFRVEGAPDDAVLNFALVESGMVSEPTAGENAGVTLAHENVVRVHYAFDPVERGLLSVFVPDGVVLENARVIVWLQSQDMLRVYGAGMLPALPQ